MVHWNPLINLNSQISPLFIGTPGGCRLSRASTTKNDVLAIGRPIEIDSPGFFTSSVDDQIVVSVGPYMFVIRPETAALNSTARAGGSASPPTMR